MKKKNKTLIILFITYFMKIYLIFQNKQLLITEKIAFLYIFANIFNVA